MLDVSFITREEQITVDRFTGNDLSDIPSLFYKKIDDAPAFISTTGRFIRKPFVLVTHDGDYGVTNDLIQFASSIPNLKKWFGRNLECNPHPLVTSIPIGLESSNWFPETDKQQRIAEGSLKSGQVTPSKLLYLNFSFWTNTVERTQAHQSFSTKSWATDRCIHSVLQNRQTYETFVNEVLDHHYVLCPRGGGLDTHRHWETLYLGRIPIVKRDTNNAYYQDLPILFVNDWSEVTEDLLKSNLERFSEPKNFNMDMLKFSWWRKNIKDTALALA